ncbi:MAG: BatD family protein [Acidobacteriia bacterium]|nr:BatD family protein [Terriglobia bacterium]
MRAGIVLALLALPLARVAAGASGEPSGTAVLRVSPVVATVGDRLDAVIEVTVPAGTRVERPSAEGDLGSFKVFEPTWEGPVAAGGSERYTLKARLAAYKTGSLEIPPFEVRVEGPGGASVLKTEPAKVEIRSVLDKKDAAAQDKPPIADLKPPASLPAYYRPLYVALSLLAALLAAAAAAWWIQRRLAPRLRAVAAPEDPFRRLPPHVWAYAELKRLLERRLADEGEVALFFTELSRILKLYLGGRYRVPLMEQTTDEIPVLLKEAGAPQDAIRPARELLRRADGVKFAREVADPGRCRASVEEAYRIVDATRPAEEPEAAEKEGAA